MILKTKIGNIPGGDKETARTFSGIALPEAVVC